MTQTSENKRLNYNTSVYIKVSFNLRLIIISTTFTETKRKMGNCPTWIGDNLTCFRKHGNKRAVRSGIGRRGMGRDLDEAVLETTKKSIEKNAGLVNVLSLTFKCEDLPNLDTFTRTDGMVVLYQKSDDQWMKLGKTEVIMDTLNPKWVKSFQVQYYFEKREYYKAVVYDVEDFNKPNNFESHDLVGEIEFSLHEVVTAPN